MIHTDGRPTIANRRAPAPRETAPECPMCEAPANGEAEPELMGALGRKLWYRCRCCGMDFHRPMGRA